MSDTGSISEGYHAFDELYDHRITLFIALCRLFERGSTEGPTGNGVPVWRSKLHSDGSKFEGWFVLGMFTAKGHQITYHLPMERWDETAFAETLERAPEFDGHTPVDVLTRLKEL